MCFTLFFLLIGRSSSQGTHDETRHYDGGLPTFGQQGQLFPCSCFISTGFQERHGLLSWWNWKTRTWFVNKNTMCSSCLSQNSSYAQSQMRYSNSCHNATRDTEFWNLTSMYVICRNERMNSWSNTESLFMIHVNHKKSRNCEHYHLFL